MTPSLPVGSEIRPLLSIDSSSTHRNVHNNEYSTFPPPSDDSHLNTSTESIFLLPSPKSASRLLVVDSERLRQISIFRFSMIAFFLVCGGPFGIEFTVIAGGPLLTFIGFVVVPIIWAIPQALLTAELSCAFPENGGYVVWVTEAFGLFSGWIAGINGVVSYVVDLALYPTLCASYTLVLFPHSTSAELFLVKTAVVLLCLIVNLKGLKHVGTFSAFVTCCVIAPFIVSAVFQAPTIFNTDNTAWMAVPKEVDWGVFLSTLLWCYTGWDSLGNLAGEVQNPAQTYSRGSAATMVLVTLCYALPTFVSIQTHPNYETEWVNGSLADFTADVTPSLRAITVGTCVLANVGLYSAGLSASSRAVWAMANGDLPYVPKIFAYSVGSVPVFSLVIHTVVVISLFMFDFTFLVEAGVLLTCIRVVFEYASFLKFRIAFPEKPRPYLIPFGWSGAAGIGIPILFTIVWMAWSADAITWLFAASVNLLGMAVYIVGRMTEDGDEMDVEGSEEYQSHLKSGAHSNSNGTKSSSSLRANNRMVPKVPPTGPNDHAESLNVDGHTDSVRPELMFQVSVNSIVVNVEQVAKEQAAHTAAEKVADETEKKKATPSSTSAPSKPPPPSSTPFVFTAPAISGMGNTDDTSDPEYSDEEYGDFDSEPGNEEEGVENARGRMIRTESSQMRKVQHRATPVYKPTGASLIKQAKDAYRKKKDDKKAAKLEGIHRQSFIPPQDEQTTK